RKVTRITLRDNRVAGITCVDGTGVVREYPCTHLISSMPLRELVEAFGDQAPANVAAAAKKLKYRDFITVGLVVKKNDCFPDNWIYIHDPEVKLGRIQNFKNWSPEMVPDPGITFLGLEYFCFEGDGLWTMKDEDLVKLGRKEIEQIGLVAQSDVTDGCVVRMPKAYPIYDDDYKAAVAEIRDWLKTIPNIWSAGRNAMHQYNNQDHSMLTALISAHNLMGTDQRDPWMVNHNAEYIEERRVPRRMEPTAS
ncbi:MAG TPA: FAD-dependent oxidoreductase, partial [Candidatus Sumerlaeota bacterium]|nr:FAD-dependent oxidoreductase [Candidatus Sumerlaeota bacterium]